MSTIPLGRGWVSWVHSWIYQALIELRGHFYGLKRGIENILLHFLVGTVSSAQAHPCSGTCGEAGVEEAGHLGFRLFSQAFSSALMSCLQDSFLSSKCNDSDSKAQIQREREVEKEGRGREIKRKTPWPQSLLCFGSASYGAACKPFKQKDQDHRFGPAGSPPAYIWYLGPLWHSVWGLQVVRVLYWSCSYNHPQGLYMGTLNDGFCCAICVPIFLDPSWCGKGQFIPTGDKGGLKTHETQAATRIPPV